MTPYLHKEYCLMQQDFTKVFDSIKKGTAYAVPFLMLKCKVHIKVPLVIPYTLAFAVPVAKFTTYLFMFGSQCGFDKVLSSVRYVKANAVVCSAVAKFLGAVPVAEVPFVTPFQNAT